MSEEMELTWEESRGAFDCFTPFADLVVIEQDKRGTWRGYVRRKRGEGGWLFKGEPRDSIADAKLDAIGGLISLLDTVRVALLCLIPEPDHE